MLGLVISAPIFFVLFRKTKKKLEKYSQIISIQEETEKLNKKLEKLIKKYRNSQEYYKITTYEKHIEELQNNLHNLENEDFIKTSGSYLGDEYDFEEAVEFQNALKELRTKEKEMIKSGRAVTFEDKNLKDLDITSEEKKQ